MSAAEFKQQGNQAFQAGKFEEAIQFYSQAIEVTPTDHILYSNRSGSYASLAKYDEALADAEKCISLNAGFAKGYQRKGFALHYLGEYEKAIESYKSGLEKDPNNQALKDGLKSAEERFNESKHNPFANMFNNPNIHKLLEILAKDSRTAPFAHDPQFMQVIGLMISNPQMATQFMQTDPRIQTALSVILENPEAQKIFFSEFAGKMKKPEQEGEHHHQEDHQHQHQHQHEHQHQHQHEHQHMEEEELPKQTHQEAPKPKHQEQPPKKLEKWEEEKNLGNDAYKSKNFQQALQHYDNAIQLNLEEPILYNNKAAVYIETKEYDKGLATLDEGLKLLEEKKDFQKKAKLLARKAKIYQIQNQYNEAIELYQQSLIEDNVQSVRDEMRKVQKIKKDLEEKNYINPQLAEQNNAQGGEFFKEGKFPDAIGAYSEAIKRNPGEPKYYCNRATAYMKVMEFARALTDLEKCLQLDQHYIKAYIKKATCHFIMKDYHKAKAEYEKGLKQDPNNQEMIQGLEKVNISIMSGSGTEEEQKQRAARASQDPEIQQILREPEIINLLNDMQRDPQNGMKAIMKNPDMAAKIEKLIAAGILKIG